LKFEKSVSKSKQTCSNKTNSIGPISDHPSPMPPYNNFHGVSNFSPPHTDQHHAINFDHPTSPPLPSHPHDGHALHSNVLYHSRHSIFLFWLKFYFIIYLFIYLRIRYTTKAWEKEHYKNTLLGVAIPFASFFVSFNFVCI
jgi:hypothetical protein